MPGAPKLLVTNANIVTIEGSPDGVPGPAMDSSVTVREGHSMLVDAEGCIAMVGPAEEVAKHVSGLAEAPCDVLDAEGRAIVPGFVDAHTHAVFGGDRAFEMKMKLAGATYMDVHKAGGGINFTVRKTRESEQAELETALTKRLDRMLRLGTTTVEVKSGYGLDCDTEMKMLRAIHSVATRHPVSVVPNYCGAHSVPEGRDAEGQTKDVIEVQIPEIVRLREAGEVDPKQIDIFCEKGFFDRDQTRRILEAGKAAGLSGNFHGDELNPMQSGVLAAEAGARAVSHLEHIDDADMDAMAAANVVGVLLPTTAYVLRIEYPPARKMVERGVVVALGSDFNPNAHCMSMSMVMNLACVQMRLTMNEALVAATLNSAAALGVGDRYGSLAVGKVADFVLVDAPGWEHLIYEMGDPGAIAAVYKAGAVAFESPYAGERTSAGGAGSA